ncbi:gamma-glutamylcyclotransferase family protein [Mucilaginibacter sp. NFX135]|uniref:gamma-glutamylcyclotransferase family protein n=1 Tax=Mucilaginibacter sp. NFX135 TaxID=3402687 RepID=UPI003AFAED95
MKAICPRLFVYGTLLDSANSYGAYLQQHCTLLQTGKFRGRLYDAGEYPAAIIDTNINQYVQGSIYLMDEPGKILSFIDDYEGFGDDQEQPNLFVRELTTIETGLGMIECWVYVYNLPVDGFLLIKSGNYKL